MFRLVYDDNDDSYIDQQDMIDDGNTVDMDHSADDIDDDSIIFVREEIASTSKRTSAAMFQHPQPQKRVQLSAGVMENSAKVITAPVVHSTNDTITFASTTTSGQQIYITQFRNRNNVIDNETLKIISPPADVQQPYAHAQSSSITAAQPKKRISAAASGGHSSGKPFSSFNEVMSAKQIIPGSADEVAAIRFCERFLKQQNVTMTDLERTIGDIRNKTVVLRAQIKSTNAALTELEAAD